MGETGLWLVVLGVVATIVGLIANLFGIGSALRNMFRRPAPAEIEPLGSAPRTERGAGGAAMAGAAFGAAAAIAAAEALRRSGDANNAAGEALANTDLPDIDDIGIGDAASGLDDLGDTLTGQ